MRGKWALPVRYVTLPHAGARTLAASVLALAWTPPSVLAEPPSSVTPPEAPRVDTTGDAEIGAEAPAGRANWRPLVPERGLLVRVPALPPVSTTGEGLDLYIRIDPERGVLIGPPVPVVVPPREVAPGTPSPEE